MTRAGERDPLLDALTNERHEHNITRAYLDTAIELLLEAATNTEPTCEWDLAVREYLLTIPWTSP